MNYAEPIIINKEESRENPKQRELKEIKTKTVVIQKRNERHSHAESIEINKNM